MFIQCGVFFSVYSYRKVPQGKQRPDRNLKRNMSQINLDHRMKLFTFINGHSRLKTEANYVAKTLMSGEDFKDTVLHN